MRKSILMKFFINTGINITMKTMDPTLTEEIIPYTIMLPPPNFLMHWGDKHSPFLHLTNLLPSDPNKLNLDSSLKWTMFHCSSIDWIWFVVKSRQTFWFFFEIKSLWHGFRTTNFSLFNLQETVVLEIGFPVCSQNAWEIDIAVLKQSFKDILTIIQSCHLVVIGGLQVLSFGSSVLLSDLNLLITQ